MGRSAVGTERVSPGVRWRPSGGGGEAATGIAGSTFQSIESSDRQRVKVDDESGAKMTMAD